MSIPERATLIRLSDTNLAPANPGDDIRGKKVVDAHGDDIGDIDDLLIDDTEKRVRFVQVASGGFLGLGQTRFLIPVDAIKRIDEKTVHVDRSREHVAASPSYDPKLVDQPYLDRLYAHYGYVPYWGPGYVYPGFPYFV